MMMLLACCLLLMVGGARRRCSCPMRLRRVWAMLMGRVILLDLLMVLDLRLRGGRYVRFLRSMIC